MPLAPLARQSRRNFSIESVVLFTARWALLIISISCRVVALCGLKLNIAEKENVIRSRDKYESGATRRDKREGQERESRARLHSKNGHLQKK